MRAATLAVMLSASFASAAVSPGSSPEPAPVKWAAKDVEGNAVTVPARDRPCLLLFVRTDQSRSQDALAQLTALPKQQLAALQLAVVVSGEHAAQRAKELAKSAGCPWPVVADPDYRASDGMSVRVWPTTLLVLPSGRVSAHLAGLPPTYGRDLDVHVRFATGAIGAAERDRVLAGGDAAPDTPEQAAQRRIRTARRLLDEGKTQQALVLLDPKTESAVARWQVALLRGIAAARAEEWKAARALFQEATKLNPQPAEAWYRLGLVYQHLSQPAEAADAFRRAFESTDTGREFVVPSSLP